jgi:hypothetical protein
MGQDDRMLRRWLVCAVVLLGSCDAGDHEVRRTCHLPILRTNEETRALIYVGDVNDYSADSCPVRVPRQLALQRTYGTLYLQWTSPRPSLLMRASSDDGKTQYVVSGPGVTSYATLRTDDLGRAYTSERLFPGDSFDGSAPAARPFSLTIRPPAGSQEQFSDDVLFEFDTVQCRCVQGVSTRLD